MLNLASKFGKVEGYIFLSMCAKIQIKTPRIAPKKTHYSSSTNQCFLVPEQIFS